MKVHMGGAALKNRAQGQVLLGALSPHPPLLIPEVGRGQLSQVECTRRAMESLGQAVHKVEPDVIVVISPHGPVLPDGIGIWATDTLEGDFGQFGARTVTLKFDNDQELLKAVMEEGQSLSYTLRKVDEMVIRTYRWPRQLDYATLVPLYYLVEAGVKTPILAMGMGFLPNPELYQFGVILRKAIEKTCRRAVVIASGDLSHRLTRDAPAGYSESGRVFDQTLWKLLSHGDVDGILDMDPKLINAAGECGYRSLIMMLGCWDGEAIETTPLSYEGPFGVGYGVCLIHRRDQSKPLRHSSEYQEHPLVLLARMTVEALAQGKPLPKATDVDLPDELPSRAGVFVTLRKEGELRGCIGTITPAYYSLAQEVINNARQAASSDPRFSPVTAEELVQLSYSVDVLSEPEPVGSMEDLDPRRFGVVVEAGSRRGLLLPDLEGIDSAEAQVAIARRKAGIRSQESVQLYRFSVQRYQ
jgi:AmmeMemoRadiSam system protein A